jgi:hypothetical protein
MIRIFCLSHRQSRRNDLSPNRARFGCCWHSGDFIIISFRHVQAGTEVIGRTLFQTCVGDIAPGHQHLPAGWKLHIMRDVEILEHLLRDPLKDWRRNLPPLVQTYSRIENHDHRNLRIIDRSKPGKRRYIFRFRIRSRGWIYFLSRPGFARGTVALKKGFASRAMEHHALQHLPHLGRS